MRRNRSRALISGGAFWRIVGPAMAVMCAGAVDMQMVQPLIALFAEVFDIDPGTAGHIVSVYAIGSALAAPLAAPIVVRAGTVRMMQAGVLLVIFGELAGVATTTFGMLSATRLIVGAGAGIAMTLCHVLVIERLPKSLRGRAVGWLTSAFFLAAIVGVPTTSYLADAFSWKLAFLAAAAVNAIALVALLVVPHTRSEFPFRLSEFRSLVRYPGMLPGLTVFATYAAGYTMILTFFAPHAAERFRITATGVGLATMFGGGLAFLAAPAGGWAADRFGYLRVARTANSMLAVSFLALPFLTTVSGTVTLYALCALIASWRFTATIPWLAALAPPGHQAPALLLNNTPILIGMFLGSYLGGWFYSWGGYALTGLAAGGVTVAGTLLLLRVERAERAAEVPASGGV
ncbi:MAG: MFS transporter [Candidatus Hydrogenedentota bacterium]|nr:MAG: MFS transporter [Candidatus Hydrogenedentota bacterium]